MRSIIGTNAFPIISFSFFVLNVSLIMISCSSDDYSKSIELKIESDMDSIKMVHVPDRRLQIFDYTITSNRIKGRSSNEDAYNGVLTLKDKYEALNLDSFEFITPINEALVNVSVGNIRSNPRHSAELSTQVLMGHQLTIWDKDGGWYYVQTPDGYLGWIDGGGIVIPSVEGLNQYRQSDKIMFVSEFGFCYEKPDPAGSIVTDLVAGDVLQKLDETGNFTQVSLPDGRKGYIFTEHTKEFDEISRSGIPSWPDIEQTAYKFMGRPYLWGGTSGKGVDCSGFTKMVYYLNGLELPRDASQQVRSGIEVPLDEDLSQLQPGDLLFFGYKGENGQKDRITHVGFHIGGGRMIHSSERVQVESLNPDDPDFAPGRRETLLVAKRMIENGDLAQGVIHIKNNPDYGF